MAMWGAINPTFGEGRRCEQFNECGKVYQGANTCSAMRDVCISQCLGAVCPTPCLHRWKYCMKTGEWPGGGGRPGKDGLAKK
jgi:hypothetical protein